MERIIITRVSETESGQLKDLVERLYSLQELAVALEEHGEFLGEGDGQMYERVTNELSEVKGRVDHWWAEVQNKYGIIPDGEDMKVNFETGEVYVMQNGCDQGGCQDGS